jgi:hypothetical protein
MFLRNNKLLREFKREAHASVKVSSKLTSVVIQT